MAHAADRTSGAGVPPQRGWAAGGARPGPTEAGARGAGRGQSTRHGAAREGRCGRHPAPQPAGQRAEVTGLPGGRPPCFAAAAPARLRRSTEGAPSRGSGATAAAGSVPGAFPALVSGWGILGSFSPRFPPSPCPCEAPSGPRAGGPVEASAEGLSERHSVPVSARMAPAAELRFPSAKKHAELAHDFCSLL